MDQFPHDTLKNSLMKNFTKIINSQCRSHLTENKNERKTKNADRSECIDDDDDVHSFI